MKAKVFVLAIVFLSSGTKRAFRSSDRGESKREVAMVSKWIRSRRYLGAWSVSVDCSNLRAHEKLS